MEMLPKKQNVVLVHLMGFVTMLTGDGHLTKRKICSIGAHLGLKISLGALCSIHRLAGDLLRAPAEVIQQFVLKQEQLNADENGWRVLKKTVLDLDRRYAQWAFATGPVFRMYSSSMRLWNSEEGKKSRPRAITAMRFAPPSPSSSRRLDSSG